MWSHREQLLKVARRRSMSVEDAVKQADLILALITGIVTTLLLWHASQIALGLNEWPAGWSPVSGALSGLLGDGTGHGGGVAVGGIIENENLGHRYAPACGRGGGGLVEQGGRLLEEASDDMAVCSM
jgi:hypothetical protein